jgi:hypothetical protein
MAAISPNLIAAEPGIDTVADALCDASGAAADHGRRAAGAAVNWSRSWDESFGDELMDRVLALLGGPEDR